MIKLNVAVTTSVVETVHVPVPGQIVESPPIVQPINVEPGSATAVNTVELAFGMLVSKHIEPQIIFPSALVIVPEPVPFLIREILYVVVLTGLRTVS